MVKTAATPRARTIRPLRFDPTGKCPSPIGAESQRCRRAIAGIPSRPALNDRVVRRRYQFIDQSRRRFAIPKVRLYGGDGNFREYEGGAPELCRTCATKCVPCKARETSLESLCLVAHSTFKRRGPVALHEIMTAVEQQEPRVIEMQSCPGRRVERRGEPIASFDRSEESFLIGQHGVQPQLAEQRVTRREAVIERTLWRLQALRDGLDRDRSRPPFTSQRASRSEKARIVEKCSSHDLDYYV